MMKHRLKPAIASCLAIGCLCLSGGIAEAAQRKDRRAKPIADASRYQGLVWPPPPDKPRIQLEAVIRAREDVEGRSRMRRFLIGASPKTPWDELSKPQAVDFDSQGRILVTDWSSGGLIRIDLDQRVWDILGVKNSYPLRKPIGLGLADDGTIFVADIGHRQVLALSPDGDFVGAIGRPGELQNPTDVAVSPDGKRLYVVDSKAHQIVLFDRATGAKLDAFGGSGQGIGRFAFPTSLAFAPSGDLFIVDQINSRVQQLTPDGEFVDSFGDLGINFGKFVRPKDVAIDAAGFIYVTDFAFNNFQIFDVDYSLLTFVGSGGESPGRFSGLSGIAVHGDRIATVDQLGRRLQLFRWIASRTED